MLRLEFSFLGENRDISEDMENEASRIFIYLVKIFDKRIMMPIIYLGHTCVMLQWTQADTPNGHNEPQGTPCNPLYLILMTDYREAQNLCMGSHSPKNKNLLGFFHGDGPKPGHFNNGGFWDSEMFA